MQHSFSIKKNKLASTRKRLYESIETFTKNLQTYPITLLDLKIIDASIKELCYTAKVFAPYHHRRKVTVFGSARSAASDPSSKQAKKFAEEMVRLGYMIMTGGGPGIMQAAQEGAGSTGSFGLNIQLPFEQQPNRIIQGDAKLVNYKYFFTRKLTMVKESDALVLFPGGFGTQDELFETLTLLQTGKTTPTPVVCIDKKGDTYWKEWKKFNFDSLLRRKLISKDDTHLIHFTSDVNDAIAHITYFYKNYHSIRFHHNWLLIRLWRLPPTDDLKKISREFKDIIRKGTIEVATDDLPYDPDIEDLAIKTLRFNFDQQSFGKLRLLINTFNRY
ncbi:MAG: Rossman fold protein, TIGR00730 family [Deltaproteobacteria bacterium GWA2_38_16]|nr:MAG: Rossman fold protein, TIGR00730 family [Deltaproteobacteria bacterium GWA2_38_16]OGQ02824.1 MAG: Rossman fold protein, TIGR00730 family [Deltaproteobacteria bacterium RIFCSPHIGHO2_02_FULL_38_15]OGQ63766.1 MAG: Rossman fold protein, TIGR00730 family [Deltaproteobacteria bacterium RIFCSPLOWO2_12_FULL_38_8]HBQ21667.1 TIGR00730 family Rossman fold protein [Deltaproteobacteria bacterium]